MARGVVVISDALIIANANNPAGSMGTFQYLDRFARDIQSRGRATAPVGNPLDRLHDVGVVGRYLRGFGFIRLAGGHVTRRRVYNKAPHAAVVEFGRRKSFKYERFATKYLGGGIMEKPRGSSGRDGEHVLAKAALFEAVRRGVPFVPR